MKIHPELSKKNQYYIPKHRYYELKHFCLQYPLWKRAYLTIDGLKGSDGVFIFRKDRTCSDPTFQTAEERLHYGEKIRLVEESAVKADSSLAAYILLGVTEGYSYDQIKARLDIPCCRDVYYEVYRRFFWVLSNSQD